MELTIEQALQQGVAAHKAGKLQDAERLYHTVLQSKPEHPDANHNLGLIAVSGGKTDTALPLFKTALEANPKIEQFWLSYLDALIKEKQLDNASKVIEQAKEHGVAKEKINVFERQLQSPTQDENADSAQPSDAEITTLLQHYQNGRYGDAEQLAVSLSERFPTHPFSWEVLGVLLKQTGRLSEALNAMQKSVQLAPQDAEGHYNLGITLQELSRLDEAEASYRQAIALKPDLAEAHNNLGLALKEQGKLDEAEACFRQAITLNPDYAGAHNNLGDTVHEQGKLDEAEASYRQAIALKPDLAEAHNNLGLALKELERLDEAEASCKQAIVLQNDYAEAHYNLGNALKEQGRLEEAEASYRQAIVLEPGLADAHNNLGIILQELGRLDEAGVSYRKAIELKPDYVKAYGNLGLSIEETGDTDEAAVSYRRMLSINSEEVTDSERPSVTALCCFPRSGSNFFHSLFDGHPELATLPGPYFKGWFGVDVWKRFAPDYTISDWRERLVAKVLSEYQPLFDPYCKKNVIGEPHGESPWLAENLGFMGMGPDGSQALVLDQEAFSQSFLGLLKPLSSIGVRECFELIHQAFEIAIRGNTGSNGEAGGHIFYHIHNPA